jgi:hypothetical protein
MTAAEAAAVAQLISQNPKASAADFDALKLTTIVPYPGSITVRGSEAFIAVDDAEAAHPSLLCIGSKVAFRGAQPVSDSIRVAPFASTDHDNVRAFAENIDPAFLPRPQGAAAAIAAGNRHPEISLPAVFEGFRGILQSTGKNLASTVQLSATREMTTADVIAGRDGENPTAAGHTRVSIEHLYHAGLWAAIRAGWRHGYNAEADHFIVTGDTADEIRRSIEASKKAIRAAAGYTKFTTDTSRMFEIRADVRHPQPWSDSEIEERFQKIFSRDEQRWLESEFPKFDRASLRRLGVKFGNSLKLNEELYDYIVQVKAGAPFDFEPSLDEAETLTTPDELRFYMHWLKARGRPAQLVPPNLGFKKRQAYPDTFEQLERYVHHKMWPELAPRVSREFGGNPLAEFGARVNELAAVAREFDGTLSIHSGSGKQESVLAEIGRATGGRFNYKISGELQLQLFDVVSDQDPALYNRMVDRALKFAGAGAFGEESALAREFQGRYLGDAGKGRIDGNLFLVFWLGNVVGSRDTDGEFFKDKLDRLPAPLIAEVRRRNARYVRWLASCLLGQAT